MIDPVITQVSFRRKFNIGNYESFDIELTATVAKGDKTQSVIEFLDKETEKYKKARDD